MLQEISDYRFESKEEIQWIKKKINKMENMLTEFISTLNNALPNTSTSGNVFQKY